MMIWWYDDVTLVKNTYGNDNGSLYLTILKGFVEELDLGNSKAFMSLLGNYDGGRYLPISEVYREIIIN